MSLIPCLLSFALLASTTSTQDPIAAALPVESEAPLAEHEVARVNGNPVSRSAFEQYVGSAESRSELGSSVIAQAHDAWLVADLAARHAVAVTPQRVDSVVARLEERSGASLADFRNDAAFQARLSLLTQQVLLMERDGISDALDPAAQLAWLETQRAKFPITQHPLSDDLAASWSGAELTRAELGATLLQQLPTEERTGLLTEFLGLLVLHARAQQLGVELDPDAAGAELAERQALVANNESTAGLTYTQIVEQTQGLSIEELVASPRFTAEVLLRQMVERNWDEARLSAFFEQERVFFEERYGAGVSFEGARHGVLQEVRRRSYQKLMSESRIVRRY